MRKTGGDKSYTLLAYFFIFNDDLRKARDFLELVIHKNQFQINIYFYGIG